MRPWFSVISKCLSVSSIDGLDDASRIIQELVVEVLSHSGALYTASEAVDTLLLSLYPWYFIPTGSLDWRPLVVCTCFHKWVTTRNARIISVEILILVAVRNYGEFLLLLRAVYIDGVVWSCSPPRVYRYSCGQIGSASDSWNCKCCWDVGCEWHLLLWCVPLPNHSRPEVSGPLSVWENTLVFYL